MTEKLIKVPGPDHPITVEPAATRVTATVAGRTIADSTSTLALSEAGYPMVYYFPRSDVDMGSLERTDHASYCPYKGDASYFSIAPPTGCWTTQCGRMRSRTTPLRRSRTTSRSTPIALPSRPLLRTDC